MVCDGRGDRGDHCCYIDSVPCELLVVVGGVPRCSVWDAQLGNPVWESAPVGRWFAARYPGFECRDWPQNIPEVMAGTARVCCWTGV